MAVRERSSRKARRRRRRSAPKGNRTVVANQTPPSENERKARIVANQTPPSEDELNSTLTLCSARVSVTGQQAWNRCVKLMNKLRARVRGREWSREWNLASILALAMMDYYYRYRLETEMRAREQAMLDGASRPGRQGTHGGVETWQTQTRSV